MIILARNLITGDGATLLKDGAVVVDKGKIRDVGPAREVVGRYPGESVVDYGDATILPGLFDMHVHLGYYYSQPDLANYDDFLIAYYAAKQAEIALTLGITTVRDLSSPHNLCKQLRLAGEKGYVAVPRIIHTDAGICMSGGHGHTDGIEQVDGADNIRAAIRRQRRDGADWIKLLTSHRSNIPEFTQEELEAAVDECHRRNIKTAVHAGTQPSIEMCINAGFDTIEHGTFMTVEQAEKMAQKGQAWTPTITAYTYLYEYCLKIKEEGGDLSNPVAAAAARDCDYFGPAAFAYRDNFKKLYDTGVTVLAGSDMVLYGAPPLPINRELAYMVEYGITPLEAIRTATANPARVLGLDGVTGQLVKGLEADVLVVEGDAAKDITALNHVKCVYLGGKIVYQR
ncbi:amidohydrolase family protein [Sporomusa acidovorans]|uniref:Amidohydrolase-related domain-containing protein n=1 Tax=Sporomusa acidovorans (strain ATCC 49682 / DSM 3132 / Mol) TaxID=1123286 RepID=A0ABZ3IY80_SPOA4|nr:amidohydrolase family protein [Sporomusa acidovorans]OZC22339.1 imidazolonepropionase [Sporomusa acidovorans DSM 3132]SDE46186.1 Imidazolonepropionase [Sporomusa acidovorans]